MKKLLLLILSCFAFLSFGINQTPEESSVELEEGICSLESDGMQVGEAHYEFSPATKEGELTYLRVESCFQGQGHGRQLFKLAVERLKSKGVEKVKIKATPFETTLTNLIKFYTKMGADIKSNNGQEAKLVYHIIRK